MKQTLLYDNAQGIYAALLATALFSVAAVMVKYLVADYHVLQILFFRQVAVLLSSVPALLKAYPVSVTTQFKDLHALRLLGAFVALSCSIWALAVLPLTTAVTLSFAQAFFVAILATVFLKEVIGVHRIAAIVVGFVGVLVVMRPGFNGDGVNGVVSVHTLIPLVGALGASLAVIAVRKLSSTESTATLLLYQSVFVGVLAGVPLWWLWETPDAFAWLLFVLMGVVAAAAQWVGIRALRLGEASVVSTIKYADLIFAAVLGFLIFGEIPDHYTVVGALIIVASALYLLWRERRSKR